TVRVAIQHGTSAPVYIVGGAILAVLLLLAWTVDVAAERRRAAGQKTEAPAGAAPRAPGPGGLGGAGGGFPRPPLALPPDHGVGVVAPTGESRAERGATPADTAKEVTGA